ncbi:MAG TPA: carboxypeptidase-like regulatory domain-containing protein [Candidatus Thermoplasmatota archaeon]|nr:carboxypeptidase-like regulatory domain-containing protein [Candidatus Thermoplasmatota archaeon]
MRSGVVVAALLLASMVLAGCAGQSGSKSDGGLTSSGADAGSSSGSESEKNVGSGKGVLAGIVVDDAIRPVGGALVDVTGGGATYNATSGADGQFRFTGLAPGAYVVLVSKAYYSSLEQAVVVESGVAEPDLVRFQLVFEASSVPFATVYKYEGFHECGLNFIRICSNVNILTGIVLCGYDPPGAPCFNVTGDRSLFSQVIDGTPTFLQGELVWEATTDTGRALNFYMGGGNQSELQSGFASAYNFTGGESPLMLRLTNHEGETAWCRRPAAADPCPDDALNWTRIGTERALLGQVDAGPTQDLGTCSAPVRPCQVGLSVQQKFTMFTTVFHGYEPPDAWRFTDTGEPPAPPA